MNHNGIFDRFHYSELAYAAARGDVERPFTAMKQRIVEAHLELHHPYRILLWIEDKSVLKARWNKDEMYDIDTVWRANCEFDNLDVPWDYIHASCSPEHYVSVQEIEHIVKEYVTYRSEFNEVWHLQGR